MTQDAEVRRAILHRQEQARIQAARTRMANRLSAPPGPAAAVRLAWAPTSKADPAFSSIPAPVGEGVFRGLGLPGDPSTYPAGTRWYMDLNTGIVYELQETP